MYQVCCFSIHNTTGSTINPPTPFTLKVKSIGAVLLFHGPNGCAASYKNNAGACIPAVADVVI